VGRSHLPSIARKLSDTARLLRCCKDTRRSGPHRTRSTAFLSCGHLRCVAPGRTDRSSAALKRVMGLARHDPSRCCQQPTVANPAATRCNMSQSYWVLRNLQAHGLPCGRRGPQQVPERSRPIMRAGSRASHRDRSFPSTFTCARVLEILAHVNVLGPDRSESGKWPVSDGKSARARVTWSLQYRQNWST